MFISEYSPLATPFPSSPARPSSKLIESLIAVVVYPPQTDPSGTPAAYPYHRALSYGAPLLRRYFTDF